MPVPLERLLAASPYLSDLNARNGGWLERALSQPHAALAAELKAVSDAGAGVSDEAAIGASLRAAKGRVALLAAAAETGGGWTTAQSTAALSDLADAALEAGLAVLLKRAHAKGDLKADT